MDIGIKIHNLAKKLWGINRSITGDGVRKTLSILDGYVKDLVVFEVASEDKSEKYIEKYKLDVIYAAILTKKVQE